MTFMLSHDPWVALSTAGLADHLFGENQPLSTVDQKAPGRWPGALIL